MNDVVLITTAEENTFDFELDIEGIVSSNVTVNFVIQTADVDLCYKCKRQSNDYTVTIPKNEILTGPTYNYRIEVIIDDIYFKPHVGIVTMVKSAKVVSEPTNRAVPKKTKPAKSKKPSKPEEKPAKEEEEVEESSISDMTADQIEERMDEIVEEMKETIPPPYHNRGKPIDSEKLKLVLKEVEETQRKRREDKDRMLQKQTDAEDAKRKAANDKVKAALKLNN
jgi:hypothetical protein